MAVAIEGPRAVDQLTVADLQRWPVWCFTDSDGEDADETGVVPVEHLPLDDLGGVVVGSEVQLANGTRVWALLGNIDVRSMERTDLFLSLSLHRDGGWFHLARYFDFDHDLHGPEQFAKFLGLTVQEVFPIAYDVAAYASGDPNALAGSVQAEPVARLSRDEIIRMAV